MSAHRILGLKQVPRGMAVRHFKSGTRSWGSDVVRPGFGSPIWPWGVRERLEEKLPPSTEEGPGVETEAHWCTRFGSCQEHSWVKLTARDWRINPVEKAILRREAKLQDGTFPEDSSKTSLVDRVGCGKRCKVV